MQKYINLFFSLLMLCAACNSDSLPKGVIERNKMVRLLTQIHIADGTLFSTLQVPDSLYIHGIGQYKSVLKSFHTDTNQFKVSMKYYCNHPDVLAVMYDEITEIIRLKTDSVEKVSEAQMKIESKRRADSIAKLPKQQQPQVIMQQATKPAVPPPGKFNNRRYYPKPNANPIK